MITGVIISKNAFPAVKKMKYGKLPDFDEKGEIIEILDREDGEQMQTAFTRYMDSATAFTFSQYIANY
ncbi:MAG: hypothetical protein V3G42_12435 [Oscillospiraceae bacterium]